MRIETGDVLLLIERGVDPMNVNLTFSNLSEHISDDDATADALESFVVALVAQGVITPDNIPAVNDALQTTLDAIDNNS